MSSTTSDVDDLPVDTEALLRYLADVSEGEEDTLEEGESVQESIYFSEDFVSGPHFSEESTVPLDILEFQYPCKLMLYYLFI